MTVRAQQKAQHTAAALWMFDEDTAAFIEMVVCPWQGWYGCKAAMAKTWALPENPFFLRTPTLLRIGA